MNRLTPLLLLVIVVGLGVAVWLQTEREVTEVPRAEVPLFEGLDLDAVTRVRIDNLERSIHVSIDRDAGGRWVLTDPIAYPVREDMFVQLLGVLGQNQAWRVPESSEEMVRKDLERPRAVLELHTAEGKKHELKMGSVAVDGQRVLAIVDGRPVRTMRNIETVLETSVLDWRSRRVFDMRPRDVIGVRRDGIDPLPNSVTELGLTARRSVDGWFVERPRRFTADPGVTQLWAEILSRLAVDKFVSDDPQAELARFGLQAPAFTLTLMAPGGREEVLEVGKPVVNGDAYFARRRGSHHVWRLEGRSFAMLFHTPDDLVDKRLLRLPREAIERIQLRGGSQDLRLTHNLLDGDWTVAWRAPGSDEDAWTAELPADLAQVDDLIATLSQESSVARYLWDEPVEEAFPEDGPPRAIWVESGGKRHGGRVGSEYVGPAGTPARRFLREREDAVCVVPLDVAALVDLTPEELISLKLTQLSEPTLSRIEISRGDVRRVYKKTIQTTWLHADLDTDALPELLPVIEHLFFLRATAHVPRSESAPLEDVVTVRITDRKGDETQFDVGRTATGEVRAAIGSRQSVLKHAPLHADLVKITGG